MSNYYAVMDKKQKAFSLLLTLVYQSLVNDDHMFFYNLNEFASLDSAVIKTSVSSQNSVPDIISHDVWLS